MSKLDDLITKMCPDGVTFVELDKLLDYEQPTKYIVKSTRYDNDNEIPVLTAGASFILGYTDETEGVYPASKKEPVMIFDDFTTSFHWVDFNFKVKSSAMKMLTEKNKTSAIVRYVYYAMKDIHFKPSNHARHWIGIYSKIRIPLPPLHIQEKIVGILDKFTTLEAELEAELEARNRQYTHYRNILLNKYIDKKKIEFVNLENAFDIRNGYTPSKANRAYWEDGEIPWFRMEDIRKNGRILSDAIQHITPEAIKGKPFQANSIIIATTATIGEHALITVDFLANQQFTYLTRKKEYIDLIDPMFAYYYCFKLGEWCLDNISMSSFASVNMSGFKKFKFPILPIDVQKEIVKTLDKFTTLKMELGAELGARSKQYEYYRNKLLTFKELKE